MFRFNFDKKYLYVVLAIIAISTLIRYSSTQLLSLLLSLPAVVIAITFHEYAHAFVADKLGDDTPRMQGRLTLNPISHIDPIGFALLLFAGFGWGRPVQINSRNFRREVSDDKGEMLVSIAGPAMNFIIALISAIILGALIKFTNANLLYSTTGKVIYLVLQGLVAVNLGLGVFNLIPLPPLDGSKIFIRFFPYNAKRWLMENETMLYIIFLAIWLTGIAGLIISPIINLLYSGLMSGIGALFGIF